MKKKFLLSTLMLSISLLVFVAFSPRRAASAKPNAKDLISTALNQLKEATSISYYYESICNYSEKDNKPTQYRYGNVFSDSKCNFGMYFDKSESEKAWINYSIKDKIFRKGYSDSSFKKFNDSDYDPETATAKLYTEYILSHLKSVKTKSSSKNAYVISAKPNWKDSGIDSISISISKKTGNITKIKCTRAKKTYTYLNSTSTYTITGGSFTYSQISFGESSIDIPEELDGQY